MLTLVEEILLLGIFSLLLGLGSRAGLACTQGGDDPRSDFEVDSVLEHRRGKRQTYLINSKSALIESKS